MELDPGPLTIGPHRRIELQDCHVDRLDLAPSLKKPLTNYVMLQRNLIYTAVTRAKKICILIGTRKALWYAVNHNTVTQRNTLLKERLQGKIIAVYQRKDDEDRLEMAAEEKIK